MKITKRELRRIIKEAMDKNPWGRRSGFPLAEDDMSYWAQQLSIPEDHPLNPVAAEYIADPDIAGVNVKVGARKHGIRQVDRKIAGDFIELYIFISEWPKGNWKPNIVAKGGGGFGYSEIVDPEDIRSSRNAKGFKHLFDNWLKHVRGRR